MNTHAIEPVDVESLRNGSLWSIPAHVSEWNAWDEEQEEYAHTYWEAFRYTANDITYTLISTNGRVTHAAFDGKLYREDEYDQYAEDYADAHEDADPEISEYLFGELFELSPRQWGSNGPTMGYFYPLDGEVDEETALILTGFNLCPVLVDGDKYGLALTGGGMDMSWHIVAGFIAIGELPPLHFVKGLRNEPDAGSFPAATLIAAALRSLDVATYQINRDRALLIDNAERNWTGAA